MNQNTSRDGTSPRLERNQMVSHLVLRILGVGAAIAVAVAAFGYVVSTLFSRPTTGWQRIEGDVSETGCQSQYVFQYNLGKNGEAVVQNKTVSTLYSQATDDAWKALSQTEYEGSNNLFVLNANPNEPILVDPILYWALEQIGDSRVLFRAPLYAYYVGLYHCANDADAATVDPERSEEAAAYAASLAFYAESAEDISLELLGEGRAVLRVSQRYLDFAKENELESLVDFGWLHNAFVLDYTADLLTSRGYPDGTISSFDGFTRSLSEDAFSVNLYSQVEGKPRQVAAAHFTGPMAQVYFRMLPLHELDGGNYYTYEDGTVKGPYVGADGLLHTACDSLLLLSDSQSCAALALQGLPVYAADEFTESALAEMNWVSTQGTVIHHGGTGFTVEQLQ